MYQKHRYKELLTAVQKVSQATNGQPFTTELIDSLKDVVAPVSNLFGITTEQAIVLSYFINGHLQDQNTSREEIINHFGKDIVAIAEFEEVASSLAQKKLLLLHGCNDKMQHYFKSAVINAKVIMAMMEGSLSVFEAQPSISFTDLLIELQDRFKHLKYSKASFEDFMNEVFETMNVNKHLPEVDWLFKQHKLNSKEIIILLRVCTEYMSTNDEVDIDDVIGDLFKDQMEKLRLKLALKSNDSMLFKGNYIVNAGNFFGLSNMVELGENTLENLFQGNQNVIAKQFVSKVGHIIEYTKIPEEQLFYNEQEASQIKILEQSLEEEQYAQLMERMVSNGMKAGLTILMYGFPGTGKTATVKALARRTGRNIFMVDIPKIQSKWVGESEKNISRVFDDYRKTMKRFTKHPILLMNEADAILGKRVSGNTSIDKMSNSLQNILLQELEDFEGIFMATTNLASHLDNAFDRRLLYKIEFSKPQLHIRNAILKSAFPNLQEDTIEIISSRFHLTGGQISNLKKKALIQSMLQPNTELDNKILMMCAEELALTKSVISPIGFIQ